jgi:hypothetical protein
MRQAPAALIVPFGWAASVAVRHRVEPMLVTAPLLPARHCRRYPPVQRGMTTLALLAAATARQMAPARIVPSAASVHCWERARLLHAATPMPWRGRVRHGPGRPSRIWPVGPEAAGAVTRQGNVVLARVAPPLSVTVMTGL